MKTILKICICIVFFTTALFSEALYNADFLDIGFGAKGLGYGGAFTGICDDASAPYWNPAGLAQLKKSELNFMTGQLAEFGISSYALNYAQKTGESSMFAINALMYLVKDIENTTGLEHDINGNAIFDKSKIIHFDTTDSAYYLSYSQKLGYEDKLYGGISLKGIQQAYLNNSSVGYGVDLGMLYRLNENLRIGANIQDLYNSGIRWDTEAVYTVPINLKTGIALQNKMGENVNYTISLDIETKYGSSMCFGGEISFFDKVAFRGGSRQLSSASEKFSTTLAGVGFNFDAVTFDYVMLLDSELGNDNRISLSLRF